MTRCTAKATAGSIKKEARYRKCGQPGKLREGLPVAIAKTVCVHLSNSGA